MQQDIINVLKLKLINASTLTFLNYSEKANMIILAVNASSDDWNATLMQILRDLKQLRHIIKFKSSVWSPQKQIYNTEKKKC